MADSVTLLLMISVAVCGPLQVLCHFSNGLLEFPKSSRISESGFKDGGPNNSNKRDQKETVGTAYQNLFHLSHDGWSSCERQNASSCRQTLQNLSCIYTTERRRVPMHFCASLVSSQPVFRPCDICPEDCVLTVWSPWSPCSETCSPATRLRMRRVLAMARHGGNACGDLSERAPCVELDECQFEVVVPIYTWKIGEWSSCRQVTQHTGRVCGLGRRLRSISCVDVQGKIVDNVLCLGDQGWCWFSHGDSGKLGTNPPTAEACTIPCDCQTSPWSHWGVCSNTCQNWLGQAQTGPIQTRTRKIVTLPENGGMPCPSLTEHRMCVGDELPECPRFEWVTEEWQPCKLAQDNDGACGPGRQARQVYCIQEGDLNRIPVNKDQCINLPVNSTRLEPAKKRACWVDCPVDCQLGEWQNWSPCSQSCEEGIKVRSRNVLVPPANNGRECGPLAEARECEFVECSWWYATRWSKCFLNRGHSDCGPGYHVRAVYCMSALDELLEDEECTGSSPTHREQCRIPCPTDCVVSEWSDWGPCSKTCGTQGGVQMRTRQILAYSNLEVDPCLSESELTQSRPCNIHTSCESYSWQVGAWEECIELNQTVSEVGYTQGHLNQTVSEAGCTDINGIQQRQVTCEKETGVASSDESLCDPTSKPASQRTCSIPCPVDCKLSEWSTLSSCSKTCGANSRRAQMQVVIQLPANGGAACPKEADKNGLIARFETCDHLPPCYSYNWISGNWSDCDVVDSDCGKGLQTRDVHCGRSDGTIVEPGVCLRELLISPPLSHQQCFIPCAGDCLLSEWSAFSLCLHDCGDTGHGGYCRMRERTIISIDPATDKTEDLCPHITSSDLVNYIPCDDWTFSYQWQHGAWQSCVLNGDAECGHGNMHRSVLCQRSDNTFVPDHFCETSSTKPSSQQACDLPCPADCIVSEWMPWSPCTQVCGQGIRTRMRDVVQESAYGGRECLQLIDSVICIEMPCEQLEWVVSEWSSCEPLDASSNCGIGEQTRDVSCRGGDSLEEECEKRSPRLDASRGCLLPCPGDCVVSDWTDETSCPTPCQTDSTKIQIRSIIRHPMVTGQQCGELNWVVPCAAVDCVNTTGYRLVSGEWSHCKAVSGDCGPGTRHRTLNCINADGFPVATHHCVTANITTVQACNIPCPVICEPNTYSDWSTCNATCGLTGVTEKSKVIEGQLGKKCTQRFENTLHQTMPCNAVPCFTYTWERSLWSECKFETERGCGYGERTRLVECRRSDGLTVDHIYCISQDDVPSSPDAVNQILTSVNETLLDIETLQPCEKLCPGDCLVSSWSQESPCFQSCYSRDGPSYVTKSRAIERPNWLGGVACPEQLIHQRLCSLDIATCPNFTWQTGPFDAETRIREVWCQLEDNGVIINVTGGCIEALRPSATLDCIPQCTAPGAICDIGRCHCDKGFEGNGHICFPISGCTSNDHCTLPNTVCSPHGQCTCMSSFMVDATTGFCETSNVIQLDGWTPTSPKTDVGNNIEQYEEKSTIWKWIVLAGILALALLCVTIGIFIIWRRRANQMGFTPISTMSDLEFPLTKMVKDVVNKC